MGSGALQAANGGLAGAPPARGKLPPGPGLSQEQVAASQLERIHKAMIALTARNGYTALKVRDIVSHAELSTRSYYQHFDGKDDCFLQTYDRIVRGALRRVAASQRGEPDWRRRARLMLNQLIADVESDPDAAHLALVDAPVATATTFERVQRTERRAAELLGECLARSPQGVAVPPLIAQGMVTGTLAAVRHCVETGSAGQLREASDGLGAWALSYVDRSALRLADLDRKPGDWRNTAAGRNTSRAALNGSPHPAGDRVRLLKAVADLVATEGYEAVTVSRIRAAARVSRQGFRREFENAEDCYVAALEERVEDMIASATRAKAAAGSMPGGVYRAISVIYDHVSSDSFLARLCLPNEFPQGPSGRRARDRIVSMLFETLTDREKRNRQRTISMEASAGAVWSVFRTYATEPTSRPESAATLTYLALAPTFGSSRTLSAITAERSR